VSMNTTSGIRLVGNEALGSVASRLVSINQ
jgi:hypothetical protein